MDKYTIEDIRDSPPFTWTLLENKVMIGSFDTEGIAELVCKLLNENDSRPRIDKDIKEMLINFIKYVAPCNIVQSEKAIEIISNLPCEEN